MLSLPDSSLGRYSPAPVEPESPTDQSTPGLAAVPDTEGPLSPLSPVSPPELPPPPGDAPGRRHSRGRRPSSRSERAGEASPTPAEGGGESAAEDGGGGSDDGGHDSAEEEHAMDYSVNEGFGELWHDRIERLRLSSPHSSLPGWRLAAFIVKSNDELLQEQFAVGCISLFGAIFAHARLPLRLRPYQIIATSPSAGFIEVVPNAKSLDSVKKSTPNCEPTENIKPEIRPRYARAPAARDRRPRPSLAQRLGPRQPAATAPASRRPPRAWADTTLLAFFQRRYGGTHSSALYRARRNFVQSVAAYSVVTHLLQVKDRHNGNILLHTNGSIVHIDFGFLLSNSPGGNMGFEAAPFKLPTEWVELMGGVSSAWFRYFRLLVVRGFQEARRHQSKLLLMVKATYLGVGGALPCFRAGGAAVEALRQRFRPEMSSSQYARFVAQLIDVSIGNWRTGAYDCYQKCCLGIL